MKACDPGTDDEYAWSTACGCDGSEPETCVNCLGGVPSYVFTCIETYKWAEEMSEV